MTSTAARRGRPPALGAAELRQRAIEIVARRGYAAVTMSQLADEIGVSVRTLHRHFASKADIVWGALDDTFTRLSTSLATMPPDLSVMRAIERAMVSSIDEGADPDWSPRERMALIATTPELQAAQSAAFRRWRDALTEFAALRLGLDPHDVRAIAIASAAQTATMTALEWWATHDSAEAPSSVVRRALSALEA